jgi:RimJ/RimL family protein N-acetyltransferase
MNVEALWQLRVRTERLELRLPTEDELLALFHVAEAGIHPPEEMPFGVAWTDNLQEEAFLEFQRSAWTTWRPEQWTCNLITFFDGRPIGTQAISSTGFPTTRVVETGSWLGAPYQGRGLGTEQRAAVLEFAFRGLGAEPAKSGALIHNVQSQRVSQKLGYRVTGMSSFSPRGEPIDHYDYRLDKSEWQCPIPVELEGVGPCLPLFGALHLTR